MEEAGSSRGVTPSLVLASSLVPSLISSFQVFSLLLIHVFNQHILCVSFIPTFADILQAHLEWLPSFRCHTFPAVSALSLLYAG